MSKKGSSTYLIVISFISTLGGFLFGYDTAIISGCNSFLETHFQLTPAMLGWVVSSALLGTLLGNVLLADAGTKVYEAVEKLRVGFIELHKKDDSEKRARLMSLIESLDEETLTQVVRAFSTYFSRRETEKYTFPIALTWEYSWLRHCNF